MKRFFDIRIDPEERIIDLRNSFKIINGSNDKKKLGPESYAIIFKGEGIFYTFLMTYDELITEDDKTDLFETTGIEIDGDGALFEIKSIQKVITILFEIDGDTFLENSSINNGEVKFMPNNI